MARIVVVIRAPEDAWTPPAGVQTIPLRGMGWHVAHASLDNAPKREAMQALFAAGLDWRLRIRTDDENGRDALREVLDRDIARVCLGYARGEIPQADALDSITVYEGAVTWLEGQAN